MQISIPSQNHYVTTYFTMKQVIKDSVLQRNVIIVINTTNRTKLFPASFSYFKTFNEKNKVSYKEFWF